MKLSSVLAKYLNANGTLNLPGFGTFTRTNTYDPNIDYGKKGATLGQTKFEQAEVKNFDTDLLDFVSSDTGKMKVLALSDLESQLDAVTQFLNTGKPYYFNGIGTLTKKLNGTYDFISDAQLSSTSEKVKEVSPQKEQVTLPKSFSSVGKPASSGKSRSPIILILTLTTIALAASAWFYFNNKKEGQPISEIPEVTESTTPLLQVKPDSTSNVKNNAAAVSQNTTATGVYKYVLETARKARAEKRFNQLKTIKWPVELEMVDSATYKIVMKLPVSKDSVRMKDSLRILSGRQVYIEK